jgi:transposase
MLANVGYTMQKCLPMSKLKFKRVSPDTEGSVEVILTNAYKIKHTPGKKTDKRDSKWLAELCLNGMIEPSRIFPKDDRDIRALTSAWEKLVNNSTQMKNRIHKELESACIKISSALTDIFGVSGKKIINGCSKERILMKS